MTNDNDVGMKIGDQINFYSPPPLTWVDRIIWRLFRIERRRPALMTYAEITSVLFRDVQVLVDTRTEDFGDIRVERWPEGVVIWVGGKIRWKSWEFDL